MNAALPCLALMAALAGRLFNYAPELLPSAFPLRSGGHHLIMTC
jgi:hypothetical protein